MRPRDSIFRGQESLPCWAAALVRQLPDGGAQAPAGVLSPITVLGELIVITRSVIAGRRPPNGDDRESLKLDLLGALGSLGPASRELHEVALNDFRKQAGRLGALLNDGAGAHALRASAEVLLGELGSEDSRSAALADVVDAFRTEDAFVGTCETRLRYLRTVLEAAGHDWPERSRRISEALSAQRRMASSEWKAPTLDELPLDQRLDEAHAAVREEHPPRGEAHVWLAYLEASVRSYLRKGPIEFYDSRIWPSVTAGHWPGNPEWTQPPELKESEAAAFFFGGLPDEGFVMVRVTLPDVPIAEAGAVGANLARAAVELTGGERGWIKMEGEVVCASGWFGATGFKDPRDARRHSGPSWVDPIAETLAELDETLLNRIAAGDPAMTDLLTDIRWRRSVAAIPDPEHRIALLVALVERLLVPSDSDSETWLSACDRYLSFSVALGGIQDQIWDAGYYGVQRASRRNIGTQIPLQDILSRSSRGGVTVHLNEVLRLAAVLQPHTDEGSMESRMLLEVNRRTRDAKAALQWLDSEIESFQRRLARAKRQRNAIAHGARPTPGLVESIEPFLDELARRLIAMLRHCAVANIDLVTHLEQARLAALKRRNLLATGGPPDLLVT